MARKTIPLAAMEKLMKKAGAERVSEDAKAVLGNILEEYGEGLATSALKLAKHAGRKTIRADDLKLAKK